MTAIYARQSIDKKDSLSIEGQIELCRKYTGTDVKVFADRGYSGKNTNRPAFTELISAVEAGQITKILVYRLDRFSRSIADFSRLWELMEKHGVSFQSVTENFDTSSPIGRAMLNIVLVFAQLERETTAERVKDNYLHRFQLGAWPGGPAPYGFDLTKIMDDGRRVTALAANEHSSTVIEIFSTYASSDVSLRQIARQLNERGIPGPKRPEWDNVTLSRLLHSPLYVRATPDIYFYYLSMGLQISLPPEAFDGHHACNVIGRRDRSKNKYNALDGQYLTVANHEGIIDAETWLKVQEKLKNNKQISRANAGRYSWLTGLLKCAECGYAVKINYRRQDETYHLICSGHSNFAKCSAAIRLDLKELETEIADRLQALIDGCKEPETLPADCGYADAMLKIEQKIERLVAVLEESSEVSAVYILREIERLHAQRESLSVKSNERCPTIKKLDFHVASFDEKKLIAAQFIERIELVNDQVNIVWKI